MKANPHFILAVKQEFNDWRLWTGRGVVLAFAAVTGLTVVAFTWLTEHALALFFAASGALVEPAAVDPGLHCHDCVADPSLCIRGCRVRDTAGDGGAVH